jgi:hypothetical protein
MGVSPAKWKPWRTTVQSAARGIQRLLSATSAIAAFAGLASMAVRVLQRGFRGPCAAISHYGYRWQHRQAVDWARVGSHGRRAALFDGGYSAHRHLLEVVGLGISIHSRNDLCINRFYRYLGLIIDPRIDTGFAS